MMILETSACHHPYLADCKVILQRLSLFTGSDLSVRIGCKANLRTHDCHTRRTDRAEAARSEAWAVGRPGRGNGDILRCYYFRNHRWAKDLRPGPLADRNAECRCFSPQGLLFPFRKGIHVGLSALVERGPSQGARSESTGPMWMPFLHSFPKPCVARAQGFSNSLASCLFRFRLSLRSSRPPSHWRKDRPTLG